MKYLITLLIINFCFSSVAQKISKAPSVPVTDYYHGVEIVDEYRNLENLEDSTVINWMSDETTYTKKIFKSINYRDTLLNRILQLKSKNESTVKSINVVKNGKTFFVKIGKDDISGKLYYKNEQNSVEKLIYDPETYKIENKKNYVISYYKPNNEGTKVAIALTEGGKEIAEIIILEVETNTIYPQTIYNTWPSDLGGIKWLNDDSGFVYVHIPNVDKYSDEFIKNTQSVLYKIGDPVEKVLDIFSKKSYPDLNLKREDFPIISYFSKSNNYVFCCVSGATRFVDYYYAEITDIYNEKLIWKPFFKKEDKINDFITTKDEVYFVTEINGIRTICKTSLLNPNFKNPIILINNLQNEIINEIVKTSDAFYFTTTKNGVISKLYSFNNANYKEIILPKISGSIVLSTINSESPDIWVYCSGWLQKNKRYKYDITTNSFDLQELVNSYDYPEFKDIVVEEIEIKSHDGIDLPLTIIYNKGMKKNRKNRIYMTGYGSYGYSYTPYFSPYQLLWVQDGGILVFLHVRGGGEKGNKWHEGGYKTTKPNTWKDLISSTEYLIKEKYTQPKYIGISGESAGGILIGRAITERPDLFKAAQIDVGMLNAIRSEIAPNGPNNIKEFGTVENVSEFKSLLEMDAYLHIKKGVKYPTTYITAGLNDPRVIAWEPTKFAAKLKVNNGSKNPILLNVDFDGGHGGDVSVDKIYEGLADNLAFFYWQLGHPDYKLKKNSKE